MKKFVIWLLISTVFCAATMGGCGGGHDGEVVSVVSEEYSGDDIGGRGGSGEESSGKIVDISKLTSSYTARNGEILTGTLGANVKISIADGATVTLRDVTINGVHNTSYAWAGITCDGNAVIILEGNNTLKGFYYYYPGIYVPEGSTLTIKGNGALTARSNGYGSGIGGGEEKPCGNIVIDGGVITATGGELSAGIGSGYNGECGNIIITGGTITATGNSEGGAGVGSGYSGYCGYINITGGAVTAAGGEDSAGIGAGMYGGCGNITITDTVYQVTAVKGKNAAYSIGNSIYANVITIGGTKTGNISESQYKYTSPALIDLSTLTSNYTAQDGDILTGSLPARVSLSVADGARVTLLDAKLGGYIIVNWAGITCLGDATIVLEGTNFAYGNYEYNPGIFIPARKTLTIEGSGSLEAKSYGGAACIGGRYKTRCGNIIINSGIINANNTLTSSVFGTISGMGAGIGGGYQGSCGDITINGGTLDVTVFNDSAAIGGGAYRDCGNITINGGTINAVNKNCSTTIGGSNQGNCGNITIKGASVKAVNYGGGSGIGGGPFEGSCGNITITDSTIYAVSAYDNPVVPNYDTGAGIGSNASGECGDITITDSDITAGGIGGAAGIGTGIYGSCGDITLRNLTRL